MTPEEFDKWRVVPRGLVVLIAIATWDVIHWFTTLEDPTFEQAGLVSVCTGAMTAIFGLFLGQGKKE
tara:strand:- start:474 stop:674 length:201 start_codon:yes stop_codon:yes gene_type:complete